MLLVEFLSSKLTPRSKQNKN